MASKSESSEQRSYFNGPFLGGWTGAAASYTGSLLVLLFPLLTHRVDPVWDAFDMQYPAFTYLADAIREGRFPLWDPYTNCGVPFHADPATLTLNPIAILFGGLFASPALGAHWFWAFYWWLGGLGMLWLARHCGAAPLGGLVAASSYALSGFFLAHAEHVGFLVVAGCLPWILLCAERAVSRSSFGDALLAGAALGFCSYTGYPGLLLFACLALTIWLALRFLPQTMLADDDRRSLSTRTLWIGITLATMAAVYVVVWSPTLNAFWVEGRGYTDRVDPLPMDRATTFEAFTWTAALSLFFPYVTFTGRGWMGCDISMSNAYVGMLTVPLAMLWGWKTGWRRCWWLVVFALGMFVVSLGGKYGLRTLLYYLYPPTRYMQFNAPFRLFWILPVCLAAGLGLTLLLRQAKDRRDMLRVFAGWALAASGAAIVIGLLASRHGTSFGQDALRLFGPGTAVLVVSGGLLWLWQKPGGQGGLLARCAPLLLVAIIFADMAIHLYNNSGTVWNPQMVSKRVEQDHQRSTLLAGPPPPRLPGMPFGYFNAQQVVKVPLVGGYVTMKSKGFDEVLSRSRFVEVLSGPQRFWLSPGGEPAPEREQALGILARTGAGQPVPVFVEQPVAGLAPGSVVPGTFGRVAIDRYAPEEIALTVSVPGPGGALLASTERYAAGWRALVDGRPQPVHRINYYFRGVMVPAGEHTVVWQYRPARWVPLVWLSYLTLGGSAVAGGVLLWRTRRTESAGR